MADVQASSAEQQQQLGPGGITQGTKTSHYYRVKGLPARFDAPELFKGYSTKPVHHIYRTTNSTYGGKSPSVHTMPNAFHAKSHEFSEQLGNCGMYRNHSLNCALDKTKPGH